jgi:hypothetical protein
MPVLRPRRVLESPKAGHILHPIIPGDLLALLSLVPHQPYTLIHALSIIPLALLKNLTHSLKARMPLKVPLHPFMQILHICNRIHHRARLEHIRILRIERITHDSRLVLALLEMRVRKAQEDLVELTFLEEIGQKLHRVGTDAGRVLVGARCYILDSESAYFFLHVLCD